MTDFVIEPYKPEMAAEAAKVMSIALMKNPMTAAFWGKMDENKRIRMEMLIRNVSLANPHTQGLVVEQGDEIVAACNWIEWPHCQFSLRQSLKFIPMLGILRGATTRALSIYNSWAKYHPQKPHWHLDTIGVLPEMQGKGIGFQLHAKIQVLLDQQRKAAYLETALPEIVRVQEHFGYTIIEEATILGIHNWFMWRSPA